MSGAVSTSAWRPLERHLRWPTRALPRVAVQAAVLAVAYVLVARLPAAVALLNGRGLPAWHPAGVAVAAFLLGGPALWPGVFVGAAAANSMAGIALLPSILLALASTIGPLLGVTFLRRSGFRPQLDRLVDVPLLVLAAICTGVVAGTLGLAGLIGDGLTGTGLVLAWTTWTMGDAASTFVVGGLLLTWLTVPTVSLVRRRPLESLVALASVAGLAAVLFFDLLDMRAAGQSVAFPVIPLLVWVAFRVGPRGTSLAAVIVTVLAIVATDHGLGPFVGVTREESVFYVVGFVGLATTGAAAVAAVVSERDAGALALSAEREALAARAAILRRLVSYSSRISAVLAEQDLYPLAVAALDAVVPADLVGLTVRDRASGAYVVRAEKGSTGSVGRPIEPGMGPSGRAIRDGALDGALRSIRLPGHAARPERR